MPTEEIQQQLFAEVKRKIGENGSVADEVAKLLEISSDSAYRRIRGEKTISLDELYKLCSHYKISLDQLMNIQTGSFMFQGNLLDSKTLHFDQYMVGMMNNMAYFSSFKEKEIYYLCKDAPIFHHWHCREFAAFKYFFWMHTLVHFPEFRNKKFSIEQYPDNLWDMGLRTLDLYNSLDSFELWNLESLNATIHQIEYYRDGQMFRSDKDALILYEAVEKTLDHIEAQAKLGYKFKIDDPQKKPLGKYHMYFNEIVLLDNSIVIVLDNKKIAAIPHTVINYMMTRDINFSEYLYQYIQNLMRRSTLISEVSEKERARFFRILGDRISRRKDALKV